MTTQQDSKAAGLAAKITARDAAYRAYVDALARAGKTVDDFDPACTEVTAAGDRLMTACAAVAEAVCGHSKELAYLEHITAVRALWS